MNVYSMIHNLEMFSIRMKNYIAIIVIIYCSLIVCVCERATANPLFFALGSYLSCMLAMLYVALKATNYRIIKFDIVLIYIFLKFRKHLMLAVDSLVQFSASTWWFFLSESQPLVQKIDKFAECTLIQRFLLINYSTNKCTKFFFCF